MSPKHLYPGRQRRGLALMIVVSFLGLVLGVGIAFLYYANQQATAMRMYREAANGGRVANVNVYSSGDTDEAPPQANDLFNMSLSQLIYDCSNGSNSVLYGHSLARAMYGWAGATGAAPFSNNTSPYTGFGRTHISPSNTGNGVADDFFAINYSARTGATRVPEMESGSYIAKNAPYTYPDENNVYLAAINPTTGRVMVPSFHRPWLFGDMTPPSLGGTNPNWTNAAGKFLMLRPRPNENPNFPYPVSNGDGTWGDVENLGGKASGHQLDSFWVDLDAPVKQWRGRFYKPMFAFLITDVDQRLNVNVAGNITSTTNNVHASNSGWGPWEMNLGTVLSLTGTSGGDASILSSGALYARYGSNGQPNSTYSLTGAASSSALPLGAGVSYSLTDEDGALNSSAAPFILSLPASGTYNTNPSFPGRYLNGGAELVNHSSLFHPYFANNATPIVASTADRAFAPSELYYLNYNYSGDVNRYNRSNLGTLFTQLASSGGGSASARALITPSSADLQLPGMQPWVVWPAMGQQGTSYQQANFSQGPQNWVTGTGNGLPTSAVIASPPQAPGGSPGTGDFNGNWQSLAAGVLGSIDLNRKLTDYRTDPTQLSDAIVNGNTNAQGNWQQAQLDRQMLALDIFLRLAVTTGALPATYTQTLGAATQNSMTMSVNQLPLSNLSNYVTANSAQHNALRRLAQLAVNIVDYIDNDDIMTPFPWAPTGLVAANPPEILFGTELPRLVINEVFGQVQNLPNSANTLVKPNPTQMNTWYTNDNYQLQMWIELHNPLTPPGASDSSLSFMGGAPLFFTMNGNTQSVYQLVITQSANAGLRNGTNLTGVVDTPANAVTISGASMGTAGYGGLVPAAEGACLVPPGNAQVGSQPGMAGGNPGNPGLYVIGPAQFPGNDNVPMSATVPQLTITTFGANAAANNTAVYGANGANPWPQPDVLLQRLANPYLAFNATTNPYITVDYVQTSNNSPGNTAGPGASGAGANSAYQMWDYRQWADQAHPGPNNTQANFKMLSAQCSYGRTQPNAANYTRYVNQMNRTQGNVVANMDAPNTAANHTFFQVNDNALGGTVNNGVAGPDPQFEWLVHLDRSLSSPIELFCVSLWKPHELTQQFIQGAGALATNQQFRHLHVAYATNAAGTANIYSWAANPNMLLYRSLSLLDVRGRTQGLGFGGRVPGKVNINTMWDGTTTSTSTVYQAMTDLSGANGGNFFAAAQVNSSWAGFAGARNAIISGSAWPASGSGNTGQVALSDTPIQPPGTPYVAAATGGQNTILNTNWTSLTSYNHPYQQNDMLNKIYNNVTTRSNTFMVWCTIGYFQVTNSGPYTAANPPVLGQELGSDDGTTVRHKFFAVVDRTNLTVDQVNSSASRILQGGKPVFASYEPVVASPGVTNDPVTGGGTAASVQVYFPGTYNNSANTLVGMYEGKRWTLAPGNMVRVDVGQKQELVQVSSISASAGGVAIVTLNFSGTYNHQRGCMIQFDTHAHNPPALLGNPGPQTAFDYNNPRYNAVVPFAMQITSP